MSVVNVNVVKQQPTDKAKTCAVGANGTPLDVVGQTTVILQLGDFKVDHQFIVANNLTVNCLLGADFLKMHSAILDCCSNTLSVGQDFKPVIPMNMAKQFSPPHANFYVANSSVHAPCDI